MSTTQPGYADLAEALIENQKDVFGAQAIQVAQNVSELSVSDSGDVTVNGDGKQAVANLAEQYLELFGQAAASSLRIEANNHDVDLPDVLQL